MTSRKAIWAAGLTAAAATPLSGCHPTARTVERTAPRSPTRVAEGEPQLRRATVRDSDRAALGLGVLRVCLHELGPNFRSPTLADTVRPRGRVLVRLSRPGSGAVVAGSEGGRLPDECALVEAPAGRYDAQVQSELGPYRVELRAGYIDTLVVTYRVRLAPVAPPSSPRRGQT